MYVLVRCQGSCTAIKRAPAAKHALHGMQAKKGDTNTGDSSEQGVGNAFVLCKMPLSSSMLTKPSMWTSLINGISLIGARSTASVPHAPVDIVPPSPRDEQKIPSDCLAGQLCARSGNRDRAAGAELRVPRGTTIRSPYCARPTKIYMNSFSSGTRVNFLASRSDLSCAAIHTCKLQITLCRAWSNEAEQIFYVEDRIDGATLALLHRCRWASAAVPQLVPGMAERTGEHNDRKTDATPNGRWKRCGSTAEAVHHDEAR